MVHVPMKHMIVYGACSCMVHIPIKHMIVHGAYSYKAYDRIWCIFLYGTCRHLPSPFPPSKFWYVNLEFGSSQLLHKYI